MNIVFTGGGTGGHFYPIIAVVEEVKEIVKEKKIIDPKFYFFGPSAFDERVLFEEGIEFVQTPAGKLRRYFSVMNVFDGIKTFIGVIKTTYKLYKVYPDVVFSKGGYGSVPTTLAAKFLRIPLIIHDSDAIPGRATLMSQNYAQKIGISYEEAAQYFKKGVQDKIALVGNPVRREIKNPARDGAHKFLDLETNVPVILVLGGSSGAEKINEVILSALPQLVQRYQVIHQTGKSHSKTIEQTAKIILEKNEKRYRYKPYGFLSTIAMKMAAGASDVVVSRAGSGSIFEIASWGKASIVVPIPENISRDQRLNAFSYARHGATTVIEQENLSPNLLISEIDRLFSKPKVRSDMAEAAKKFSKPDAAKKLAEAVLETALEHET